MAEIETVSEEIVNWIVIAALIASGLLLWQGRAKPSVRPQPPEPRSQFPTVTPRTQIEVETVSERAAIPIAEYVYRDSIGKTGNWKGTYLAYYPLAKMTGSKYGVPPILILAQACNESGLLPTSIGTSGEGGISQMMPNTAREIGLVVPIGIFCKRSDGKIREFPASMDPLQDYRFNPALSFDAQARKLKGAYQEFGSWNDALAAYNRGNAGWRKLKKEGASYPEYVQNVNAKLQWLQEKGIK